jgi:hypothetical protein
MFYMLVRQAILERKAVFAIYGGLYRELCPHAIGTKDGKEQALCYQFGGRSRSRLIQPDGSPDNWRCIEISELRDASIHESAWHTAPACTRPQWCVDSIDIEL